MAKEPKLTRGDRGAARYKQPGTQQQKPAKSFIVRTPGGTPVAKVDMNYRGVAGGLPTQNADDLRRYAKDARESGATDSARAAESRAKNVDGHNEQTKKAKAAIKKAKIRAQQQRAIDDRRLYAKSKMN